MPIAVDTQNLHPATELMIEGIYWLHERHAARNVLDLGCGSGILTAVAASIWDARVLAVDISEKAVADTRNNIIAHGLEDRATVARSNGFSSPEIAAHKPFDLIFINLLAEPIVSWATDVKLHLSKNGIAALGGILAWQTENVQQAYKSLEFEITKEYVREPWHLLVVKNE